MFLKQKNGMVLQKGLYWKNIRKEYQQDLEKRICNK
jgi:hypothetical protein